MNRKISRNDGKIDYTLLYFHDCIRITQTVPESTLGEKKIYNCTWVSNWSAVMSQKHSTEKNLRLYTTLSEVACAKNTNVL